jgi:hypothetical protein
MSIPLPIRPRYQTMGKAKKSVQVPKSGGIQVVFPGGFGRAAEKFVDTIRHVVDLSFSPNRIRAKIIAEAEGEAAAMAIRAEASAKVLGIRARAAARVQKVEVGRQENIESVVRKAIDALPLLEQQVSEEPVDKDWTSRFFREGQDISDDQMQQIWARILAGEVAQPGSFAPRTLSIVRDLTKQDANLFAKLCSFTWDIPGTGLIPVIHIVDGQSVEAELNVSALMHLTSIGLIEFNVVTEYLTETTRTEIAPSYYGKVHQLKSDGGASRSLSLGHVVFTSAGGELAGISNAVGNDRYEMTALDAWSTRGWKEA